MIEKINMKKGRTDNNVPPKGNILRSYNTSSPNTCLPFQHLEYLKSNQTTLKKSN